MLKELTRKCPVCGSATAELICPIKLAPVAGESLPPDFDVVICSRCGFCFDDIDATQKDFDEYYRASKKYAQAATIASGDLLPGDIARYEAMHAVCQKYLKPGSKILDIGAGKCGFLSWLKNIGYTDLYGVEPSCASGEHEGITLRKSVDDFLAEGVKFDAIFCSFVLEHIYDLAGFIESLKSLYRPGGICYVEVPGAEYYHRLLSAPFYYFDREHINHFTLNSLQNLFTQHGMLCMGSFAYSNDKNIGSAAVILKNANPDQSRIIVDNSKIYVERYVELSKKKDDFAFLESADKPLILWGMGAYLRRVIAKDEFPTQVDAIIDRDRGDKGENLNGIPIFSKNILKESPYAMGTLVITSVLYAEQIKAEIKALGYEGRVISACSLF